MTFVRQFVERVTYQSSPLRERLPRFLVRVHAAAVNYPDVLIAADRYQVSAPLPFTPSSEFAGVVTGLGPGVSGPAVGSPVAGAVLSGAFAEQVVAPLAALRPIPDGLLLTDWIGDDGWLWKLRCEHRKFNYLGTPPGCAARPWTRSRSTAGPRCIWRCAARTSGAR
ncbi:alcohol dehydrogenase catalytic domain-containing protein [Streptomyces sp. V4I2]|uniref:alcohol dehydrogenase catalytic domain-containing protein n=1 Tax=Streptomyces sp. V4I2 TaxID=3042280 RepID=UPI0027D7F671|nr:alcohol dehydrogenase catalytic domain-containing protein [Streptomyces sp. V4I2]